MKKSEVIGIVFICVAVMAIIITLRSTEYKTDLPCYDNHNNEMIDMTCEGTVLKDNMKPFVIILSVVTTVLFFVVTYYLIEENVK